MRALALLVVIAACGRFGFTSVGDGAGGGDDSDSGPGPSDTPPVACSPAFDVCDSFENGVDQAVWVPLDPGVTLDTTRGHRGTSSIRVHLDSFAPNTNNYARLKEANTLLTNLNFFVRGWFYLPALPAGDNGMEIITAHRPASLGDYVFVRSTRTTVYSQFSDRSQSTTTLVPAGSWFCLVFEVVRTTMPSGSLQLTGDVVPTVTLSNVATDDTQETIQWVTFGMGFASGNVSFAQPAIDLWIDDVIIADGAVTCDD
jgi:hypothetical protein